ncbi:MAG: hypothetical protein IGQ45_07115 [Cyanobacterium sp. T60_A2020_053]|nr:hypothetical protein [Cyanobacterium sp. T60_A2020_053]
MFLTELSFICNEISRQPIAFLGGFFAGILKLDENDEPLASWLKSEKK